MAHILFLLEGIGLSSLQLPSGNLKSHSVLPYYNFVTLSAYKQLGSNSMVPIYVHNMKSISYEMWKPSFSSAPSSKSKVTVDANALDAVRERNISVKILDIVFLPPNRQF